MSAEDNENNESMRERITTNRSLAEELLREMPDMKDEIEIQLNALKDAAEIENNKCTAAAEKSKNSLNDLKRFRLLRKRSEVDLSLEKQPKVLKLDNHVTERKSIIEIRLNNEAAEKKQRERDLQELDNVRKLKEEAIIDLEKLKQKEEQLQKLEAVIVKQEQEEKMVQKTLVEAEETCTEKIQIKEECIIVKQVPKNEAAKSIMQEEACKVSAVCGNKTEVQQNADAETLNLKDQSDSIDENVAGVLDDKENYETATTIAAAEDKHENYTTTSAVDIDKQENNTTTSSATATTSVKEEELHFDDNSDNSAGDSQQPPELNAEEEARDQELRASRATFLQHLPCFKLQRNNADQQQSVPKCRECRRRNVTPQTSSNDVYCRFYEFRKLQYNAEGELLVAGFPNPYTDPTRDDLNIWQPDEHTAPTAGNMDIQVCRYILLHAGDQFCYLWRQEAEALKLHENPNSTIAWKKVVQGIREICDVCDTTLFNYHWTCDKCGFGVCVDCFRDRKEKRTCNKKRNTNDKTQRGHDEFHWLLCTATTPHHQHEVRELMLTQIIAGDSINVLGRLLHDIRALWHVPQVCGCLLSKQQLPTDSELSALIQDMIKESQLKQHTSDSSLATEETMRKQARMEQLHSKKLEFARAKGIDYVPGRVWTKQTLGKDPITTAFDNFKHINFLRKGLAGLRRFLPPRAMTLAHSTLLAPGVPHEWLCDGKLLRLTNAMHPDNRILYQEVWKCGQPVVISEVAHSLNLDLWRPEAFCRDFGDKPNDLINCLNGNLVPNQPMRHFWEGFQCIKKRLLDHNGRPMLLKLKDWPPGDDFAEILPTRFADLMKGLPMPEYTLRTGNLNIASCLPKMFVPPDLGPKMYNAYGSALHPDKGTTNLHLDISDAVNIMVYVGIPQDSDSKSQLVATQRAIAMGGCDYLTRARSQSPNVMPGALWHIFPARDADKIRDLLNRVTLQRGFRLEPDHDPIHDQNWYLDDKLRARLFKDYGVEGYPIVQCLGDAVFIPAGAPHQVQNLHNCIKVAEDFVSPENITHCYHLTHEFRRLSHSHTNHEDKLQIKNIIYHAIKDCCHILVRALHERIDAELEKQAQKQAKIQTHANDAVEFISNLTSDELPIKAD